MRPDRQTNTEAQAAAYEHAQNPDDPYPGGLIQRHIACRACQNGRKNYLCGPCTRELWRAQTDNH